MLLPLSGWHVVMGWIDLATDIAGIIATIRIAQETPIVCDTSNPAWFFWACAALLIFLVVGNQTTAAVLACRYQAIQPESSCGLNFLAGLRGLLGIELGYQEHTRHYGDVRAATTAALNLKMNELFWEVPITVVNVGVLAANLYIQGVASSASSRAPAAITAALQDSGASHVLRVFLGLNLSSGWAGALQLASTLTGLVSLTLAALEFMRMHPAVFWASPDLVPETLLFHLIDIGPSWFKSLVIGLYAFFSVTNRAIMYTMVLYTMSSVNVLAPAAGASPLYLLLVMLGAFWLCALLLLQTLLNGRRMRQRQEGWSGNASSMPPAAIWLLSACLSTFFNMPWTAAPGTWEATAARYTWPSWVMAFCFPPVTITLAMLFAGLGQISPCIPNRPAGKPDDSFVSLNTAYGDAVLFLFTIVPVVVAFGEFVLFISMSGWVADKRRRILVCNPSHSQDELRDLLGVVTELPGVRYSGSWLVARRVHSVEAGPAKGLKVVQFT